MVKSPSRIFTVLPFVDGFSPGCYGGFVLALIILTRFIADSDLYDIEKEPVQTGSFVRPMPSPQFPMINQKL